MPIKEENNFGEITISETVLRDITYKTVEKFMKEEQIFNQKIERELSKNIRIVHNEDDSLSLTLKIPAKYGENIVDFSKKVQKSIKEELEKMSEIFITNVDITIESLEYINMGEEIEENVEEDYDEYIEENTEETEEDEEQKGNE
ncbi:MAG: Asp23/Gls24 family envelope stress response protein [Thermotogota bacterium]